jgi:hypothetical protein
VKRTLIQLSEVDDATNSGSGGIILSEGLGGLTILDSTLQGSSAETTGIANAALGGAIYSNAPLTIRRSTIRGNTVSADQDNTQERGGGVYVAGDQANIVNSTFFDNRAGGPGDNDGLGGAVYAASGTTHIKHVTFDSNQGSDDADSIGGGSGVADFFGSIIDDAGDPCEGSFVSSVGFNVTNSNDPDCALLGSDVPDGDADLDVFGDNGGFTETFPRSSARRPPASRTSAASSARGARSATRALSSSGRRRTSPAWRSRKRLGSRGDEARTQPRLLGDRPAGR